MIFWIFVFYVVLLLCDCLVFFGLLDDYFYKVEIFFDFKVILFIISKELRYYSLEFGFVFIMIEIKIVS